LGKNWDLADYMKNPTIRKLTDDVAVLLQKLVRLKSADSDGYASCVTCGVRKHWKELQGGHWIERGKQATKIMEENIHPQCQGCNGFGMKFHTHVQDGYSQYMREMYGDDFCEQMLIDSNKPVKRLRADLEDLKKEYADQIKGMV
jgi:hypothetical protein|tara:strand:+ start:280 stop:714 length:435 start_codon:yes stop_codon:yes gene_type:complete